MGEIDTGRIKDSFLKIKKDIEENAKHIKELGEENRKLREQIQMQNNELISKTIKESIAQAMEQLNKPPRLEKEMLNKLNRNKKNILRHKILDLVGAKEMALYEIKDVIVDEQHYCSKATFYRYIEEMQKKKLIEIVYVNERKIVAFHSAQKLVK